MLLIDILFKAVISKALFPGISESVLDKVSTRASVSFAVVGIVIPSMLIETLIVSVSSSGGVLGAEGGAREGTTSVLG